MKYPIIMLLSFFSFSSAKAQVWEEWFKQKETAIKYLLQQVAALKVYGASVWKGYEITREGLDLIGVIRKEDHHLHDEYFQSLKKVNPIFLQSPKFKEILLFIDRSKSEINHLLEFIPKASLLTKGEQALARKILLKLQSDEAEVIESLNLMIEDGHFQMKDDERIKRIHLLYEDQKKLLITVRKIRRDLTSLVIARSKEQKNIQALGQQYGFH